MFPLRRPCYFRFGMIALALVALTSACGDSSSSKETSRTSVVPSTTTPTSKATTTTTTTPTTSTTTTTTASTTTSTTAVPSTGQPELAIWPFADTTVRYSKPTTAAKAFATEYLGFVDPIVGDFQQGDSRSGEVAIRYSADGPLTTVMVRKVLADESWWVIGATNASLQLTTPTVLAAIASPVTLSGTSTAFEATFNAQIREDGSLTALVDQPVMGGSNGEMGPFSAALSFTQPKHPRGAIVLREFSMKDGATLAASVLRIKFAN